MDMIYMFSPATSLHDACCTYEMVYLVKKCMLHMAHIKKACCIDIQPFQTIAWCMLHAWNVAHIQKMQVAYGTSQKCSLHRYIQPFEPTFEPTFDARCIYALKSHAIPTNVSCHTRTIWNYCSFVCVSRGIRTSHVTHLNASCHTL